MRLLVKLLLSLGLFLLTGQDLMSAQLQVYNKDYVSLHDKTGSGDGLYFSLLQHSTQTVHKTPDHNKRFVHKKIYAAEDESEDDSDQQETVTAKKPLTSSQYFRHYYGEHSSALVIHSPATSSESLSQISSGSLALFGVFRI